jgi:thiol:disulfide interchange protein DsbD
MILVATGAEAISNDELLDASEAFPARVVLARRDAVEVSFKVAKGYYLYRDKLEFAVATEGVRLGTPVLPKGKVKHDQFFGKVEIYRGNVTVRLPLQDAQAGAHFTLQVESRGCADIGVCYPPLIQSLTVQLPPA